MTLSRFERLQQKRKLAEARQFDITKDLASLIDTVADFPAEAVLEQVREIEETRHLFELVDIAELQEQDINLTITCAKSGNVVHQYTVHDYLALREIHGQERALEIMQSRQFSAISPVWLYTDPKALDALQIADPYGYCVYALTRLLTPLPFHKKMEDMPFHIRADWHQQKAQACKNARKIPLTGLVELNEMARRFLAVIMPGKAKVKFSFETLDSAVDNWRDLLQEIKDNLEEILAREMRKGRVSEYVSYGDIVELRHIYQGYGQFAAQRKPKEKSETEAIADMIDDIFSDEQIPRYMSGHEPEYTPRRLQREQAFSGADISAIVDSAFAELDAETAKPQPQAETDGEPAPQQPQKLTFAQMIALRKKG